MVWHVWLVYREKEKKGRGGRMDEIQHYSMEGQKEWLPPHYLLFPVFRHVLSSHNELQAFDELPR